MSVVELRRYRLRPGARETLIELFQRELVAPQEAVGAHVMATFRDLGDPDVFVWMRRFDDMASRRRALGAFYGGPDWQRHREAANATMLDSDDVLLLRLASPPTRPAADVSGWRLVVVTIYALGRDGDADAFATEVWPGVASGLAGAGVAVLGAFATEPAANDFPALPVREGEGWFVWLAGFDGTPALDAARGALDQATRSSAHRLASAPEVLRLTPIA